MIPRAGRCFNCKAKVTSWESYCFGCRKYVCLNCEIGHAFGNHTPADHLTCPYCDTTTAKNRELPQVSVTRNMELARLVLAWDEVLFNARGEGDDEPVGQWGEILKKAMELSAKPAENKPRNIRKKGGARVVLATYRHEDPT